MTYNLLNGAVEQLDDVIEVVMSVKPDFLTLNEANEFDANNGKRLKEFAKRTNFPNYHLVECGDGDCGRLLSVVPKTQTLTGNLH